MLEYFYNYRDGYSLEHKLEMIWYREPDPVSIFRWRPEDAHKEFARAHGQWTGKSKTKWVQTVRKAEALIKKRLGEALVSESEYIREYAKLLYAKKHRR